MTYDYDEIDEIVQNECVNLDGQMYSLTHEVYDQDAEGIK